MAATNAPIIVIKKIKKKSHEGHHGGAWKVAYADFVTAMMAFFLLLWLLNATTEEQRKGISDYFAPNSVSKNTSGSGGMLGGLTLTRDGSMRRLGSAVTLSVPTPPAEADETQPLDGESPGAGGNMDEADRAKAKLGEDPEAEDIERLRARRETQSFEAVEKDIRETVQSSPELSQLVENLIIDQTPEGLRIQLVDQDKTSMFAIGSAVLLDHARKLLGEVGKIVQRLPNRLAVSGHTDSTPYSRSSSYTNWELSSDRAQAARRAIIESGVEDSRIQRVVGMADRDHLFPNEPNSPRNRRLSIIILRDNPLPGQAGATRQAVSPRPTSAPSVVR